MTHPNNRGKKLSTNDRRRWVASLIRSGVTKQTDIAERVGVTQGTISKDIKVLEAEWKLQAAADIETAKGLDLHRIDVMIHGLWEQARTGDTASVDRMTALLKRRAEIFGYDAPKRTDNRHAGHDGKAIEFTTKPALDLSGLTDEELEQFEQLLAKAGG